MADLRFHQVVKKFGSVETIRGVDLEIADREFVVFVGPSGCGKSTLLRMISGLEHLTSGTIEIGGRLVNDVPPSQRGVAMVFQSYALYPHLSVRDNIAFGLRVRKTPKTEIESRLAEAVGILQLGELLDRYPRELSGGQRQRVAIGRAIVGQPEVFLFDEPLSNLDAELRVHMRAEIAGLHKRLSNTMIYVTHDQVEAMTMADRIVVLRDGRIEQVGSPETLYKKPDNLFVAQFIGSPKMNIIEAANAPTGLRNICAEGTSKIGVRPEHLRLTGSAEAPVEGSVATMEYTGAETLLFVEVDGLGRLCVVHRGDNAPAVGEAVGLSVEAQDLHQFDSDGMAVR